MSVNQLAREECELRPIELESNKPLFFVDAWLRSLWGSRFRLDYNPPLLDYLSQHYEYVGTVDLCDFYRRRSGREASVAAPLRRPSITAVLAALEDALQREPKDGMLRVTRADLLVQEGRYGEAIADYEMLLKLDPTARIVRDRLSMARAKAQRAAAERTDHQPPVQR